MWELKDAVDAAIIASGKSAAQIARALDVDENTISRVRTGAVLDPGVQLIRGIARETNTPAGVLLGDDSTATSTEDEQLLSRFRRWIDEKLANIDARKEPNAEVLRAPGLARMKLADRKNETFEHPFGADVRYVLRALGDSMIGDGIRADDTLYANAADPDPEFAIGSIVACRFGGEVFVKRLASEHGRHVLLSANPRYLPIVVDAGDRTFEIFGIVVGRIGRVG